MGIGRIVATPSLGEPRPSNEVYPLPWYESLPANSFSIAEFESYCQKQNIRIEERICYAGDWKKAKFLL